MTQMSINNRIRTSHHWWTVACALLAAVVLSACGMVESDLSDCDTQSGGSGSSTTYLQVTVEVSTGAGTRADDGPDGGEDGDGREDGINNENDVNNVMVVLFTAEDGIDADDADATITNAFYFSSLTKEDDTYVTPTKEVTGLDMTKTYHVLVVANVGDLTSTFSGMTLSQIRDYLVTTAWTSASSIEDYSNFVMSSEEDATLEFSGTGQTGTGTKDDPYTMSTTIERVAARIDFETTNGTEFKPSDSLEGYVYKVYASATANEPKGYLILTHVMPFNELTYGSYLIKRVCTDADGTELAYLGDETCDADKKATNYVIDPLWDSKGSNGSEDLSGYYTRCYTSATAAKAASDYDSWGVQKANNTATTGEKYYILDYTLENTTNNNSTTYATGLYFRGTYYEATDWDTNSNQPTDTSKGSTRTYAYYLRHSDPEDSYDKANTMLYGVVRNNIYRVSISKVIESDTQALSLTINVRKWAYYKHSDITM